MLKILQQLLNDPLLIYQEVLQALWSGYGEISRYYSPKLNRTVIVKSVSPPEQVNHPRGWHSSIGHQRKLTSYKIEAYFYQHYAQYCTAKCFVPQLIFCTEATDETGDQILVMEDLKHLGFDDKNTALPLSDIKAVIHWLAHFHARFIGHQSEGLWSIGSYWHLNTRQDEYNNMQDGPLKQAAHNIDNKLNNAFYQTIVHGDAKLANFCFSDSTANNVAAVDFQYVGKSVGVKDLAYFLGSCLSSDELTTLHDELLDYYFSTLALACTEYHPNIDFTALEKEWRNLYPFANADFHRFLQGWSPEHHKINRYLHAQTELALQRLT